MQLLLEAGNAVLLESGFVLLLEAMEAAPGGNALLGKVSSFPTLDARAESFPRLDGYAESGVRLTGNVSTLPG